MSTEKKYETRDADAVSVALAGLLVVLGVIVVTLLCAGLFHYLYGNPLPARNMRPFPEPRLQVAPELDLAALRARDDLELHSYGWIDRRAGVVRIPIERAMDMVLEKGVPVRGQPGASPAQKTDLELQQERALR